MYSLASTSSSSSIHRTVTIRKALRGSVGVGAVTLRRLGGTFLNVSERRRRVDGTARFTRREFRVLIRATADLFGARPPSARASRLDRRPS